VNDDRVWLQYPGHGDAFACPKGAVKDWQAMGWVPCDEPAEPVSPVVAENLAAQQAAAQPAQTQESTKAAGRGESKEG
jgi:hypothetical protein